MKLFLIAFFSFTATGLSAQTNAIAFKSHSGNMDHFKAVLENNLFGEEGSNFGLPSSVSTYKLDSVIYISGSKTVLVRRHYSREYNEPKDSARFVELRRDTVYNHPLFTRQHSLDSIRTTLKKEGNYTNPVREIIFVGYDNKKNRNKKKDQDMMTPETRENTILPLLQIPGDNPPGSSPFDGQLFLVLGLILVLSLAGGLLSWKLYQPGLQKV